MEILELLNPWWKEKKISTELALQYRRRQFAELKKLVEIRPITVITGLRRVGKSVLMYQLIEELISRGTDSNYILYFSFDQKVDELLSILKQYEEILDVDWKHAHIYVFLDEIQKLQDWSTQLKLLYDRFNNIKFVVSGSNSFELEKEAVRNLAGRHFKVNVEPLNFAEYIEMKDSKIDLRKPKLWEDEIKKEFSEYLLKPYPELIKYKEPLLIKAYIKENIVDRILREDLSKFKGINEEIATNLINIFYGSPGMYINYDKLSADLRIGKKTLLKHVFYLEFSYLIRRVRNYRPSIRSASRKMQRIYPYHFSLQFGWNGQLSSECEATSAFDSNYYWNDGGKEVDIIILKDKMFPIEVKETNKISHEDLRNLAYFMAKFRITNGAVLYNGEEDSVSYEGKKIILLPFWKVFTIDLRGDLPALFMD